MGTNSVSINASGVDTETLIEANLKTYQDRYDKLYKKKVEQEWKKEAYNSVYNDVKDYRNGDLYNYKLSSYTTARTATSTNSDAVTATVTGSAIEMTHDVKVQQLASAAYLQTFGSIAGTETDLAKLAGINITDANKESEDVALRFTIGDGTDEAEVTFSYADLAAGKTLNDLASRINKAGLNVSAVYDSTNRSFSITNKSTGAANKLTITAGSSSDLAVAKEERDSAERNTRAAASGIMTDAAYESLMTDFLQDVTGSDLSDPTKVEAYLATKKGITDTNFVSSVQTYAGKIAAYNTAEAAASEADIASTKLLETLDFASYNAQAAEGEQFKRVSMTDLASEGVAGTNAKAIIDGKSYDLESNSVSVANVTYNLNSVTTGSAARVTVSTDVDALMESVQNFVDNYNKMLDSLNEKIHETYYSDYMPLTEDEESAMKDADIEKWNEKAHSGLLKNSSQLQSIVEKMREALYTPIEGLDGKYNSASSIGISASGSWDEYGHLYIDEDKLRAAIEEDSDVVYKIFSTNTKDYDTQGIAHRLSTIMDDGISAIKSEAGITTDSDDQSYLGLKIQDYESQLKALNDLIDEKYNFYYKKYSAMEQAISNMQSALSSVTAYLGN